MADTAVMRELDICELDPVAGGLSNPSVDYAALGNMGGADIMAVAFVVMMDATKSAQRDLKSIMGGTHHDSVRRHKL
jgi:hypothetical protein